MERLFKCRTANIHFYRGTIDYELFRGNDRLDYSKAIGNCWKDGAVRNRPHVESIARCESQLALNLDENLRNAGKNRLVSVKFGFRVTSSRSPSIGTVEHD